MLAEIALRKGCLERLPPSVYDAIQLPGIPLTENTADRDYLDCEEDGTLVLRTREAETVSAQLARPHGFHGKQPLITALSPARGGTIIDATAGLGDDTLKLAMIGMQVVAIERHPLVYALLVSALWKAKDEGITEADRISLQYGDATEIIPWLQQADVIYIDPMFPDKRRRSALPPKNVRVLRELVGADTDSKALLDVARRYAGKRVVVKRPLHAPTLADDPVAVHKGKVVRYEVYLPSDQGK
jgi:16S rRNA (guanine1516-N2)-methyltransferase